MDGCYEMDLPTINGLDGIQKKKKESEISQSLLNQQRFETPHRKTT